MNLHPNQLSISSESVRNLVDRQFPAWKSLPIEHVADRGTVNSLFRIGRELVARFPLRWEAKDIAYKSLQAEADAARALLGSTRFPTPAPIAIGEPNENYPLPWSIYSWLPGTTAAVNDPSASDLFALDLAEFVLGVRSVDVGSRTFAGTGRGGDLKTHDEWVETCLQHSERLLDVGVLREMWKELRELPRNSIDLMTHGDLIPSNVLAAGGRLVGVIDVGGLGPADPALDLVGAWHMLEPGPREAFRGALRCDDVQWERGKAWALQQALGLVWYYLDSLPDISSMGQRTLQRLVADRATA